MQMNIITPHMVINIQNMHVPHMLSDSVGSSVGKLVGFSRNKFYPTKGTVDAISHSVINHSQIIRPEPRI